MTGALIPHIESLWAPLGRRAEMRNGRSLFILFIVKEKELAVGPEMEMQNHRFFFCCDANLN